MLRIIPVSVFCLIISAILISCDASTGSINQSDSISFTICSGDLYSSRKNGLALQGCAINNGILYQFRHSGLVDCFELRENGIHFLNSFLLESAGGNTHCNSAQFDKMGEHVYISSWSKKERACYVEKISPNGSRLTQTITVGAMKEVPNKMTFNLQIGNDGFLWLVGCFDSTLRFIKFKTPDISLNRVELSESDILDIWDRTSYSYENEVYQGMKIYDGNLYLVYGGTYNRRGVWVYNTSTHKLVYNMDLSDKYKVEFEDIEFYGSKGFLFVLDNYFMCFNSEFLFENCNQLNL